MASNETPKTKTQGLIPDYEGDAKPVTKGDRRPLETGDSQ